MIPTPDANAITHGIQLAIAPVFLLTAVAGMIGAVAARLARVIDRARLLEERLQAGLDGARALRTRAELATLRTRGLLANGSIGLLTLCAFLIGLTIILLFVGETTAVQIDRYALVGFLAGVVCFMLASILFFIETIIASRVLDFGRH